MLPNSKSTLHLGLNFVIAPMPELTGDKRRDFEGTLAEAGLEFENRTSQPGEKIQFGRQAPPLNVQVGRVQPNAPVGQLLIVAPHPARPIELFEEEATLICDAFSQVWDAPFQILSRDCTIRHLYDADAEHAFQYLWEQRLGQPADALSVLGRNVLGGGLRFVMPPTDEDQINVEIKVESYLKNTKKIYVDVAFSWVKQLPQGNAFDPQEMLDMVESFATDQVVNLITGGNR